METVDRMIDVPAGRVFTRTWTPAGAEGRPPVVLLHDSLGSVGLWRDFPDALAARVKLQVIAYDRLGFGRSDPRDARPSFGFIDEEAETYVPAVLAGLEIDRFALFGHSVGGGMSVAIGARLGERCEAIVTVAAQAFVEERTLAGIREAQAGFARPEEFRRLTRWHDDKAAWVLDAWTGVWLDPGFRHWNLDQDLAALRCRILAIHGADDEYGSAAFPRRIASLAGGPSEMVLLEDCGHMPHVQRREEVLELVARFFG